MPCEYRCLCAGIDSPDGFCIYGRDWRGFLYEHQPWAERGAQGAGDHWKCLFYDFSYIGGSNSPAFTEPGKNTILAGQQQRYVPLRRNLFYNICLRDFCIASWMWAEPVYSGTGVCKAGHVFSGTWSCGKCGS